MAKFGLAVRCMFVLVGVVAALFGIVGWAYHHDAKQLGEFYEKRTAVDMKLRTLKVCLDMEQNPERWRGTSLKPPCEYDKDQLRDMIPEYQDALDSWNRTISERETLLKERKSGVFKFIADRFGDPYD